MAKTNLHCSFCGRSRDEVKILIAGQEGHICENCVDHAQEIIDQELSNRHSNTSGTGASSFKMTIKKPIEIKTFLDDYVIGQDDAKKDLPVARTVDGSGFKLRFVHIGQRCEQQQKHERRPLPDFGHQNRGVDRKSTRLNSSHSQQSRMPSSA